MLQGHSLRKVRMLIIPALILLRDSAEPCQPLPLSWCGKKGLCFENRSLCQPLPLSWCWSWMKGLCFENPCLCQITLPPSIYIYIYIYQPQGVWDFENLLPLIFRCCKFSKNSTLQSHNNNNTPLQIFEERTLFWKQLWSIPVFHIYIFFNVFKFWNTLEFQYLPDLA